MDTRLPAHLEVSSLIRSVNGAGGFATVIEQGERDAGTILVVLTRNGAESRLFERMPQADGSRKWHRAKEQTDENAEEFDNYLKRRKAQDPDLWILELDIANGERFIDSPQVDS